MGAQIAFDALAFVVVGFEPLIGYVRFRQRVRVGNGSTRIVPG